MIAADTAPGPMAASSGPSKSRQCIGITTTSTPLASQPSADSAAPARSSSIAGFESWGKYVWFRPEEDDPNAAALSDLDGQPAEGILRANSEYPHDDFWWDSQSRITPAFPAAPHFLEPYAHALAELDACRITRGGLFLDKAHGEALQQFARAYRPLPAVRFDTVGHTTDPVAARTAVENRRRYWYAVNREYYPIDIEVDFSAVPADMHDLAADTPVAVFAAIQPLPRPLRTPLIHAFRRGRGREVLRSSAPRCCPDASRTRTPRLGCHCRRA